jgi:pimeloyl-ACP methyl ester carboxylesterase
VNRAVRRAVTGATAIGVGIAAAVATERYLVRRARAAPDPDRDEPLSELPSERRTVRSFDGTELEVRIAEPRVRRATARDPRPTLVFSHGFSLDMTTWRYQWKDLSRRYRCVLYDQRGHGRSELAASGAYTIETLGRDLRAVLDATVVDGHAVLLGHSMGGMAVLSLAEHHPEEFGTRVVGAILANSASGDLVKEGLGDLAVKLSGTASLALLAFGRRRRLGRWVQRAIMGPGADVALLVTLVTNFAPGAAPSVVDHAARVSASTSPEVWPPFLHSLLDLNLRRALANVRVPALVIVGERDRMTPPGGARSLTAELPDGRLVVLARAGHLAMLEAHEAFTDAVGAFLRDAVEAPVRRSRRTPRTRSDAEAGAGP